MYKPENKHIGEKNVKNNLLLLHPISWHNRVINNSYTHAYSSKQVIELYSYVVNPAYGLP